MGLNLGLGCSNHAFLGPFCPLDQQWSRTNKTRFPEGFLRVFFYSNNGSINQLILTHPGNNGSREEQLLLMLPQTGSFVVNSLQIHEAIVMRSHSSQRKPTFQNYQHCSISSRYYAKGKTQCMAMA
ncbi:hypothetical protein V6N13_077136 [Hibiscus sabdariffa]|uniref:Uncharacterized protein n=1 Tax=Hibiscus sabdariffa TaxID=183260 RepID=A0ABR2CMZ2_9ROSI